MTKRQAAAAREQPHALARLLTMTRSLPSLVALSAVLVTLAEKFLLDEALDRNELVGLHALSFALLAVCTRKLLTRSS